ncbi:adhesion G protein-coupled receptor B2 isoform X1 [Nematostella vectensis]|uniref:adhesion G protein-coupled receptor B2 isoform X1 n=1 Tax=Nematostella vectensis TaxID=45351 RepID=UPI0020772328|nr:adhesion G protein-coupled receptor B2 isoform X1 [Nematostella vectensis]
MEVSRLGSVCIAMFVVSLVIYSAEAAPTEVTTGSLVETSAAATTAPPVLTEAATTQPPAPPPEPTQAPVADSDPPTNPPSVVEVTTTQAPPPPPVVTEAPTTVPPPVVTDAPTTVPPPVVTDKPTTVPPPVVTDAPTTVPPPVVTDAPTTVQPTEPPSTRPPPIDGNWSVWGAWSACSVTCGSGQKTRRRACNNPAPSNGGQQCLGDDVESGSCMTTVACPVDGRWTEWGDWDPCSKTCGAGFKTRKRTCTNPPPSNGGLECSGNAEMQFYCTLGDCPVDGGWSAWSEWSKCPNQCGIKSMKNRTRTCTSPRPGPGGKACNGSAYEEALCVLPSCPVDGGWSEYGPWSVCSKSCGGGERYRERTCTNPSPVNGGKTCDGIGMQSETCNAHACNAKTPTNTTEPDQEDGDHEAAVDNPPERTNAWKIVGIFLLILCIILILIIVYLCARSIRNKGEGSISKGKKKKEDKKKNGKEEEIALDEKQPLHEENANA